MKLDRILKNIEFDLNKNIRNLNYGGCGIVAAYLGKELLNKNISHSLKIDSAYIIDPYKYGVIYYNVKDIIKELNDNFLSFNHSWIEIGDLKFNDCGYSKFRNNTTINKKSEQTKIYNNIIEGFNLQNTTYSIWNTKYDMSQNKKIKNIIKNYLNDYNLQ